MSAQKPMVQFVVALNPVFDGSGENPRKFRTQKCHTGVWNSDTGDHKRTACGDKLRVQQPAQF